MATFNVTAPDGSKYQVNAPGGASEQDAINYVQGIHIKQVSMPPADSSASKGGILGGVGMGLRDAVDAGAQLADRGLKAMGVDTDAISQKVNAAAKMVMPDSVANTLFSPQPVDTIVRNANADYDASRQMAGRSGVDLARVAGNIINPVNRIVPFAGANTAGQVAMRAGLQGAISGAATPIVNTDSFGTNKLAQIGIGGALGAAGGVVANKLFDGIAAVAGRIKGMLPGTAGAVDPDAMIQAAAAQKGIDLSTVPASVLQTARQQVADAMATNRTVDPAAVLRAAEGKAVLGPDAALTVGQSTLDPVAVTREMNLRGIANAGEPLMNRYNLQNNRLVQYMNQQGAAQAPGEYAAGQGVINALRGADAQVQGNVSGLYNAARDLNGADIPLDHRAFADTAMQGLDSSMKGAFLPEQFKTILNNISSGKTPLNVTVAEQLKTMLATAQRSAQDGNVRQALGIVRDSLENAPLLNAATPSAETAVSTMVRQPVQAAATGPEVVDAFNAARTAARNRFQTIENTPALRAALDDAAPDSFFQKYILKADTRDVNALARMVPDQMSTIKAQTVDYLKSKALNGASDEVGSFSQAGYNKALNAIGDAKLNSIFTPEEVAALHSVGRVASYTQVQPRGSAVNNSNTAAAAMNLLSMVGKVSSLPGINLAKNSVNQFLNERAATNALAGTIPTSINPVGANALRALLPYTSGTLGAAGGQSVK